MSDSSTNHSISYISSKKKTNGLNKYQVSFRFKSEKTNRAKFNDSNNFYQISNRAFIKLEINLDWQINDPTKETNHHLTQKNIKSSVVCACRDFSATWRRRSKDRQSQETSKIGLSFSYISQFFLLYDYLQSIDFALLGTKRRCRERSLSLSNKKTMLRKVLMSRWQWRFLNLNKKKRHYREMSQSQSIDNLFVVFVKLNKRGEIDSFSKGYSFLVPNTLKGLNWIGVYWCW